MHPALAVTSYLVFVMLLPLILLHPKLRQGRAQRWGRAHPLSKAWAQGPRIWMHGASAGDILALMPTARRIAQRLGPGHIMASTITNSGFAMAQGRPEVFDRVIWCPYDLPHATARVLDRERPDVLVLEYTELWPNLIRQARRRKIPIVLHNGRLSAARRRSYRVLFALTGNLLRHLSLLLMRDASEAQQALQLGAMPQQVMVTGNTKFDNLSEEPSQARVASLRHATGFLQGQPVIVAGSTHEGEEEQLMLLLGRLRARIGPLSMIVAPRYTERAERIMGLAQRQRLHAVRRSHRLSDTAGVSDAPPDVFILDTVGELSVAYALGQVVFVGGSFVPRGGQNILEPAACGKPVLFGPHMHNFVDSLQVLLGRGGLQMSSWEQLEKVMGDLLLRPQDAQRLGQMGQKQVRAVRGAADRNAHLIAELAQGHAGP